MKKFFSNNGIWILAAAAAIAVILCIMSAISSGTGFLHNAAGAVASPFRAARTAVSNWVTGIGDHFDNVDRLQTENDELRRQVADLEKQLRQAQTDSEENVRLRQLLGLHQQHNDFVFETALITERSSSNWSSSATLNKGTHNGVVIGDCVVDAQGYLVGVVTEAGSNWCKVSSLLDTSTQFGAFIFRTGETAVTMGDLELMNRGKLKLGYLSDNPDLINGDLIVTSGLGGFYPSGLVIGSVEELQTDDSGMSQYAVLQPKTDLASLTEVFIITAFDAAT